MCRKIYSWRLETMRIWRWTIWWIGLLLGGGRLSTLVDGVFLLMNCVKCRWNATLIWEEPLWWFLVLIWVSVLILIYFLQNKFQLGKDLNDHSHMGIEDDNISGSWGVEDRWLERENMKSDVLIPKLDCRTLFEFRTQICFGMICLIPIWFIGAQRSCFPGWGGEGRGRWFKGWVKSQQRRPSNHIYYRSGCFDSSF